LNVGFVVDGLDSVGVGAAWLSLAMARTAVSSAALAAETRSEPARVEWCLTRSSGPGRASRVQDPPRVTRKS
jgi:hypothetical protein